MTDNKLTKLEIERSVCQLIIRAIDQIEGDPSKGELLEIYKSELARIDGEIAEITGTPPPVVVGLKPAKLTGKAY